MTTTTIKLLLVTTLLFIQAGAKSTIKNTNDNEALVQSKERGIISNIIGVLRPSNTQQAQPVPLNINPPAYYPDTPLAPTFQIPSNIAAPIATQNKPPSLLGGLLNILTSREQAHARMENVPDVSNTMPELLNLNDTKGKSLISNIIQARPISGLFDREVQETMASQYNLPWVNAALAKCARIDPALITAVFPTEANGLREPRMYYFENSTSNRLRWKEAQNWCSAKGMNLLTVYSAAENKIIQQKLEAILGSSNVGGTNNKFWIGLNDLALANDFRYIGDSTSTFTDWLNGAPATGNLNCVFYSQTTSAANIHMENIGCGAAQVHRFICEVSPECTALFMSRYKTQQPNYGNHHHNEYYPFKN